MIAQWSRCLATELDVTRSRPHTFFKKKISQFKKNNNLREYGGLKLRITCNFDRTRIIAYLNYASNFVTLQNLKPEKLIIENNM